MIKFVDDYLVEVSFVIPRSHFLVSESDYPPAAFFQLDGTNQVFATLNQSIVACPVYLNKYTRLHEGKIRYSMLGKQWVLGSISLSQETYMAFHSQLRGGLLGIKSGPITKEHAKVEVPEWGPESP